MSDYAIEFVLCAALAALLFAPTITLPPNRPWFRFRNSIFGLVELGSWVAAIVVLIPDAQNVHWPNVIALLLMATGMGWVIYRRPGWFSRHTSLRFSMRTMFVVITLFSVLVIWIGGAALLVHQRHEFLSESGDLMFYDDDHSTQVEIPLVRRWLGDRAVYWIQDGGPDIERAKQLFPEARDFSHVRP